MLDYLAIIADNSSSTVTERRISEKMVFGWAIGAEGCTRSSLKWVGENEGQR
jgi:hypothetical protein